MAADELRAELAGDRAPSSSTATSTSPTSASSAAPSAASARASARPTPTTSPRTTSPARIGEAVEFGATEICMQGGIHPDLTLEEYGSWLRLAKEWRRSCTCTPTRRWRSTTCASARARRRGGLRVPDRVRAGLDAGDRRRGARRRRPPADLAEQAAGRPLGRDHRSLPPRRAALDLDGDVRPHRGAARAGPPHARWCARCRSAPAASPSSSRSASSPSTRCSAAPTGSRRSRRGENLKHTAAFRLALGKTIPNLQASWVKMGLEGRHRVAALGRQRPRRHPDGGEHLAHGRLPARGAAGAGAADRGGPRRRPRARPAHDALRDRRDLLDGQSRLARRMRAMVLDAPGRPLRRRERSCRTLRPGPARC